MIKITALYTFLNRLSKRERIIAYAAFFIISLALLERLIIHPISSKMDSLNKQIRETETEIKTSLHIVSQKDRIVSESSKYKSFLSEQNSEDEEMTALFKEIENLANKSSVYLVDMKPMGLKETASVKKYMATLNCEAQMEQLADFMYNIENSTLLLSIEKYEISPKSRDSSIVKCSMTIAELIAP